MKLYTEEQVNKIALQVKDNGYWNHLEITPIELPSDEEIEKFSEIFNLISNRDVFVGGAKYVINKIKQQENGK